MSTDSQVLGVIIMTRHGDRLGFYQNPDTYTASDTEITPLGNQQSFQLGEYLRSRYMDSLSPYYIQNISQGLVNPDQVLIRADAGGEGEVIYDSAMSTLQGLWPANTAYNDTLANGTLVVGPLGGYQVRGRCGLPFSPRNLRLSVHHSTLKVSLLESYPSLHLRWRIQSNLLNQRMTFLWRVGPTVK